MSSRVFCASSLTSWCARGRNLAQEAGRAQGRARKDIFRLLARSCARCATLRDPTLSPDTADHDAATRRRPEPRSVRVRERKPFCGATLARVGGRMPSFPAPLVRWGGRGGAGTKEGLGTAASAKDRCEKGRGARTGRTARKDHRQRLGVPKTLPSHLLPAVWRPGGTKGKKSRAEPPPMRRRRRPRASRLSPCTIWDANAGPTSRHPLLLKGRGEEPKLGSFRSTLSTRRTPRRPRRPRRQRCPPPHPSVVGAVPYSTR